MQTAFETDESGKIILPPPYTLHRTEQADVLQVASDLAPTEGAGTLVVHQAPGLVAFAVVLEPEQPLAEAQMAFLLGMVAVADALAAHCPPERSVRMNWPDEVLFDKARLGGGRFAVAPGTGPEDVPDWMVFAAELIADRDQLTEPGALASSTSLKEEAFDPAEDIISTFASYMMLYFDRWAHDGIEAVTNRYLMRIDPPLLRGVRRIEGDRLVEVTPSSGGKRSAPLLEGLGKTGWRDAQGPKL
ncbi:biotin/lipoate--protein ligase family protein [Roseinatronobacter monicus]|uniref:Biotin/lipoate A/B protein ligase family protein n=1 Tax=Roseinatronobacter monicus TaxID=393481 RepID=A0A543KHE5_9RHOB|nr:biotin/lipoate--protein ligase family protein [Roseinatronobacter monicus]TQM94484.1 biotin/lipoate A/B protein ligase family protein [Roseinatronobacter monicus]